MVGEFEQDLPYIFRGLLDLIASILLHLPIARVVQPERMLGFVHWLAAMESADGVPVGVYQAHYSDALSQSMRDSLECIPLAAAVLTFMEGRNAWEGTPRTLYEHLDQLVDRRTSYSRDWPSNETAMGKLLRTLQAGLLRQGYRVDFPRRRERTITIVRLEDGSDATEALEALREAVQP